MNNLKIVSLFFHLLFFKVTFSAERIKFLYGQKWIENLQFGSYHVLILDL